MHRGVDPEQFMQTAPPEPQALLAVPSRQVFPSQQPVQLEALQVDCEGTHAPAEHTVPAPHLTQATPPVPQALLAVPGWQVFPSQQPFGQLPALHCWQVPFTHVVPFGQFTQATPPVPQALLAVPGWQVFLSQQPLLQTVAHEAMRRGRWRRRWWRRRRRRLASATGVPSSTPPPTRLPRMAAPMYLSKRDRVKVPSASPIASSSKEYSSLLSSLSLPSSNVSSFLRSPALPTHHV
jgi:hypothetical protein